ncbi:aminotransferase class V-fold PLP-dependent enzyme [Caulobacter sp. RHG1]|uniref:aminotransferase class V-fold PLP-dependent enzyme n=1 Tax=Caulobacter sp. (strain RHG1) TaxID=2545762 RepID=UPI0019D50830|nr:aminotransferase class V-fold PLP-dependent enzyme [Caulobacter sp. RHG1]NQE63446.1 Cysteine desulfurase [Caulobacter sp. RHG1]
MSLTRRTLFTAAAAAPALAGASDALAQGATALAPAATLPARSAFARMPTTYLDSGSTHPMPLGARAALEEYLRYKTRDGSTPDYSMSAKEKLVRETFAELVGATPDELCVIQSTTMGENLVLKALGYPQERGRIVTDALHFFGSFYTYGELSKAGVDVVTLRMTKDGRIDMDQMAAAVNDKTKLIALSLVSTVNGFEHDLKAVCDLAHAHGAYVYADIVHAAGVVPVNLRETGVDFAATSSYKWLMGDFGLGFLYVRKEIQEQIPRPWWGYEQVVRFQSHVLPYDPPGATVADAEGGASATGRFAMGTTSWTGMVQLAYSLPWIKAVGVEQLVAHRRPLAQTIQTELRQRGYEPLTPLDNRSALVAFALKDARAKLAEPLKKANVTLTVSANRFRVSLAAFNDANDIDRLLSALPKAPPA